MDRMSFEILLKYQNSNNNFYFFHNMVFTNFIFIKKFHVFVHEDRICYLHMLHVLHYYKRALGREIYIYSGIGYGKFNKVSGILV